MSCCLSLLLRNDQTYKIRTQSQFTTLIEKIISGFLRNVFRNVTNNTWTQSYGHEQEDLQEPQETQEKCQTKPKGAILINNVILGLKSIATFKVINIYEKKPLVFMRRYKCNCHPWSRNPLRHYSCTFSLKGGNILTQWMNTNKGQTKAMS